jgi:hypothetical protein
MGKSGVRLPVGPQMKKHFLVFFHLWTQISKLLYLWRGVEDAEFVVRSLVKRTETRSMYRSCRERLRLVTTSKRKKSALRQIFSLKSDGVKSSSHETEVPWLDVYYYKIEILIFFNSLKMLSSVCVITGSALSRAMVDRELSLPTFLFKNTFLSFVIRR